MAGGYIPRPIPPKPQKWPQPINEFDIITRLRSTRADMIGTCDEQHYNDCQEAADEIARLRDVMYRVVDEDCTVAIQNGCFYADGEPLFSVPCSRTSERTAAAHATPSEGASQSECRFRDSRIANDPVAWGIECDGELLAAYTCEDEESAVAMVERFAETGMTGHVIVPLCRSPTLTDAEREAVETAALEADAHQHRERAATLRGLLDRTIAKERAT